MRFWREVVTKRFSSWSKELLNNIKMWFLEFLDARGISMGSGTVELEDFLAKKKPLDSQDHKAPHPLVHILVGLTEMLMARRLEYGLFVLSQLYQGSVDYNVRAIYSRSKLTSGYPKQRVCSKYGAIEQCHAVPKSSNALLSVWIYYIYIHKQRSYW